jgi:hypothetical protein
MSAWKRRVRTVASKCLGFDEKRVSQSSRFASNTFCRVVQTRWRISYFPICRSTLQKNARLDLRLQSPISLNNNSHNYNNDKLLRSSSTFRRECQTKASRRGRDRDRIFQNGFEQQQLLICDVITPTFEQTSLLLIAAPQRETAFHNHRSVRTKIGLPTDETRTVSQEAKSR